MCALARHVAVKFFSSLGVIGAQPVDTVCVPTLGCARSRRWLQMANGVSRFSCDSRRDRWDGAVRSANRVYIARSTI